MWMKMAKDVSNRMHCIDTVILMDDALHWFHREINTGLFDECLDYFQEQQNDLRIMGLTDEMFHSMKPGYAAPVLADVKYGLDNSILGNDKRAIVGWSEDELEAYNIDPALLEQGRLCQWTIIHYIGCGFAFITMSKVAGELAPGNDKHF